MMGQPGSSKMIWVQHGFRRTLSSVSIFVWSRCRSTFSVSFWSSCLASAISSSYLFRKMWAVPAPSVHFSPS